MRNLIKFLETEGYTHIRIIDGKICGIKKFIFTTGLVVGLDECGFNGRYCYEHRSDAVDALREWDGNGDPSGEWIKYKGKGGERSNNTLENKL